MVEIFVHLIESTIYALSLFNKYYDFWEIIIEDNYETALNRPFEVFEGE